MQGILTDERPVRDPQPADNLVLWLPVFLMCGIGFYFLLPSEPDFHVVCAAFAGLAALAGVTWRLRDFAIWRWGAVALLGFMAGVIVIQARTMNYTVALLPYSQWNRDVTGEIDSFERVGSGWRVMLGNARIGEDKTGYVFRLTIRQKNFMPEMGGRLTVKASLMSPSPPMVPDSFDFRRHAFYKGISGYGYVTKILDYVPPAQDYRAGKLELYRDWLTEKVYDVLDQPEAGIVTALLNGQRAGITKQSTVLLQKSGLQHVISISGLHVSLLAMVIFFCLRFLMACHMGMALRWPIKKIAAFFALVGIVFYLMIVGSTPPTLRAVLVTGTALLAVMLDREPIQMRVVALAALAIMLVEPESVIDIGFQMSFAAVIGLVIFYQATRGFWTHGFWRDHFLHKLLLVLCGTVATSIVATCVTAPLVLYYFQQVPLLSMLANVLASAPITFLVMPGTFLSYILTPVPVLGEAAIIMMGWGVKLMMDVAEFVARLPASVWQTAPWPFASVVLVMVGLWVLAVVRHAARWTGLVAVVAGLVLCAVVRTPDLYLTGERVVLYPQPDSDTLWIEGRLDRFNRDIILKRTDRRKIADFPCDQPTCDFTIAGRNIRLVREVPALQRACDGKPDLVITRYYLDYSYRRAACDRQTVIIDRHALREGGGQAIWLQGEGPSRVETVYQKDKRRPWQRQEEPRRYYGRKKSGNKARTSYNRNQVNAQKGTQDAATSRP